MWTQFVLILYWMNADTKDFMTGIQVSKISIKTGEKFQIQKDTSENTAVSLNDKISCG